MTRPTNPVVDVVAVLQCDREAAEEVVAAANLVTCDGYYELDIDAVAQVLAKRRQSADAALVEVLEKCLGQFVFMAKLASGSRVYEIEKATGKRVRRPLGEVISSECEVAATYVRAALQGERT